MALSGDTRFSETREESPLSTSFFFMLDSFLASRSVQGSHLEGICIITGPGSFTSLRVICAAVLGLKQAWNIPVGGWSAFTLVPPSNFPFVCPDQNTWAGQLTPESPSLLAPSPHSWTAFEEDLPALNSLNIEVAHSISLFSCLKLQASQLRLDQWPSPTPFYVRPNYVQHKSNPRI